MISTLIGATIYSGYKQKKAAKKSAKEMRAIGRATEKDIRAEGAEDYRRSSRSFEKIIGKSQAIIAGSGIGGTSKKRYIEGLRTESERQLEWITTSAASRGAIAKQTGYAQAKRTERAGSAAFMNSLISAFGIYTMSTSPRNIDAGTGTGPSRYQL